MRGTARRHGRAPPIVPAAGLLLIAAILIVCAAS